MPTIDTNEYLSYSIVGIKENYDDTIYNLSPTETPVINAIGKARCINTLHQWQTDVLPTLSSTGVLQGQLFNGATITPRVKLTNVTQIFGGEFSLSGTAKAVQSHGANDEFAYQTNLFVEATKNSIETAVLSNNTPTTGNSTTVETMRPLLSWYATNVDMNGGTNGSATTPRTDGTDRSFSETLLKNTIQSVWQNSRQKPNLIVAGGSNRMAISGFAGPTGTQRWNEAKSQVLYTSVSVYASDFGDLDVVADRFQVRTVSAALATPDVHILNTDLLKMVYLRPLSAEMLGKAGDDDRMLIRAEATLQVSNEAGCGLITDLTSNLSA
jgi:hypothetical protein